MVGTYLPITYIIHLSSDRPILVPHANGLIIRLYIERTHNVQFNPSIGDGRWAMFTFGSCIIDKDLVLQSQWADNLKILMNIFYPVIRYKREDYAGRLYLCFRSMLMSLRSLGL